MIVELKGVEFDNKGAALMLYSIIEQLTARFPTIRFALTANQKSTPVQRKTIAQYRKLSLRKLFFDFNRITYYLPEWCHQYLMQRGYILEGKVDAIIDASGFAYSDQWSPYMSILHLSGEIKRCSMANKPYIFLPQAFGPFRDPKCQSLLASALPQAALICPRDQRSTKYLTAITGTLPQLKQYGDFTNLFSPIVYKRKNHTVGKRACIIVNHNMTSTKNPDPRWQKTYIPMIKSLIKQYKGAGLTPFFLNHEGHGDGQLIQQINQDLPMEIEVLEPNSAIAVKQIISASDAVFSSRFHGCVSALSSGIPCLGTSWSHKYQALYNDYNAADLLLNSDIDSTELQKRILHSLNDALSTQISNKAIVLKQSSEQMWQEVEDILRDM